MQKYTDVIDEFVRTENLIDLCDMAADIYGEFKLLHGAYCTPTVVWALMLYAGSRLNASSYTAHSRTLPTGSDLPERSDLQ